MVGFPKKKTLGLKSGTLKSQVQGKEQLFFQQPNQPPSPPALRVQASGPAIDLPSFLFYDFVTHSKWPNCGNLQLCKVH